MKTYRALVLALAFLFTINSPLFGWGNVGHMAVAYAAYQKLTPAAKKRVTALLKLNPDFKNGKWAKLVPAGTLAKDRPMVLFMIAATWPDQIKSESGYTDDGSDNGERPDGSGSSQNTGYTDHLHHKYWHFIDTPFSQDGTALPAVPTPNAEERIVLFRTAIASGETADLESYDLVWLLHLVGDIHQPLHAATRVSATDSAGDSGGNNVKLCKKPCKDELHAFWDGLPGSGDAKAALAAGKKLPKPDATLAKDDDPADWAKESFDAAQASVYVNPPIGAGDGPFTLTQAYRTNSRKIANARVSLAGARLATLINANLK